MSRSLAKSGKAVAIKSLKEKWEKRIQSAKVNGEKEIGGSSTITWILNPHSGLQMYVDNEKGVVPTYRQMPKLSS